jgi:hypothetical protein
MDGWCGCAKLDWTKLRSVLIVGCGKRSRIDECFCNLVFGSSLALAPHFIRVG